MKHDTQIFDASREAQTEGIPLPVFIDNPLMETLTPSPYLESLGITREQRIANFLRFTRTMMNPLEEKGLSGDTEIPVPFSDFSPQLYEVWRRRAVSRRGRR